MLESEYKITLDVHEINAQHILFCKQGDTARRIIATLTEESELYPIAADCTAVFSALKPDGKILFNEAKIVENTIVYDFTDQTANVSGKLDCELRLYGYGNNLLTSPRFSLLVHPAVYADLVESKDEVNVLTELISQAVELMDSVNSKLDNGDFIPKLSIGTVQTLPTGSSATVELGGSGEQPVLNFGIPQGPEGQAETLIPDAALSADSTKPVQNRVIALALQEASRQTEAALGTKADAAETDAALAKKADQAETTEALSAKVDKVSGKGLSANDFTDAYREKLTGIEAGANNYSLPPSGVGTSHLADGAVTREKLADDALYSPLRYLYPSNHNYSISASDSGKTILADTSETECHITLTKEVSDILPVGTEMAIARLSLAPTTVVFDCPGIFVCAPDVGIKAKAADSGSITIPDIYGMIALKKLYADMWLVTGNVEVVS